MKKVLYIMFIVGLFQTIYSSALAQAAAAKLNFEEAEIAFNAGDLEKTLSKLQEAERLFGKVNPPILYLRIMAQRQLLGAVTSPSTYVAPEKSFQVLQQLRSSCKTFLDSYGNHLAVAAKYREVFEISEKLTAYPSDLTSFKAEGQKVAARANSDKLEAERFDSYLKELAVKIDQWEYSPEITTGINFEEWRKKYKKLGKLMAKTGIENEVYKDRTNYYLTGTRMGYEYAIEKDGLVVGYVYAFYKYHHEDISNTFNEELNKLTNYFGKDAIFFETLKTSENGYLHFDRYKVNSPDSKYIIELKYIVSNDDGKYSASLTLRKELKSPFFDRYIKK